MASPTYGWGTPGAIWGGTALPRAAALAFQPTGLFSPGLPLVPPDPERVRVWDFPPGYNLVYTPRSWEEITFADLRALANYDLVRLAIEKRKDQIEKFEWAIVSRDEKNPRADARPRIAALTEFWSRPDGRLDFAAWLREALEDLLVVDAPAFEMRRTRGGDLLGLDVIDGATLKVLTDDTGRTPEPPAPAYEQVIHGRPWALLTSDQILYAPRNRRPNHAYGMSPVQQVYLTINVGYRRLTQQLQYYTEGNVPEGLISSPADWTAEQIQNFQDWFDSTLAGNTAQRNRVIWAPNGAKYQPFKSSPADTMWDEWLARIICFAFSLPPTALVNQVNRATGEQMQEAAQEEGNQPLRAWVKRLADYVIQRVQGHTDLEFAWQLEEPLDPEDRATMLAGLVKEGVITRNQARDELGYDPDPDGDRLMVDTGTGPVLLSDIVNPPEPQPMAIAPPAANSKPAEKAGFSFARGERA